VAAVCGRWLHWEHSIVVAIATVITVLVITSWVAQDVRGKERS